MLAREQAFVLKTAPYREGHRMVTLLSERFGLLRAIAKHSQTPGSSLYPVSQPFVQADFLLRIGQAGLSDVLQGDVLAANSHLRQDYTLAGFASACAEWLLKAAGEEGLADSGRAYRCFGSAIRQCLQTGNPVFVFVAFQICTLREAGILLARDEFAGWRLSQPAHALLTRLVATEGNLPEEDGLIPDHILEVLFGLEKWIFDQTGIVLKSLKLALQLMGVDGTDGSR